MRNGSRIWLNQMQFYFCLDPSGQARESWSKNGTKINQKWSESGPGRRQGVPENQQKYEQIEKRKRKHKNEKRRIFVLCSAISSKNGGLNGWAFTDVFFGFLK